MDKHQRHRWEGRHLCKFAIALLAMQLTLSASYAAYAAERIGWLPCGDGRTEVRGSTTNELALICSAAIGAAAFLQDCGLSLPEYLRLEIVQKQLKVSGHDVFGCLDVEKETIRLLDLARCSKAAATNKAYAALPADQFYKSIVAHEVAHMIFRSNLDGRSLPWSGHEYVAYAVQISLMPNAIRERFLTPIRRSPPTDLSRFSGMLLLMAPETFGAMAYDHFSPAGKGCKLLRNLLDGYQTFPVWDELD